MSESLEKPAPAKDASLRARVSIKSKDVDRLTILDGIGSSMRSKRRMTYKSTIKIFIQSAQQKGLQNALSRCNQIRKFSSLTQQTRYQEGGALNIKRELFPDESKDANIEGNLDPEAEVELDESYAISDEEDNQDQSYTWVVDLDGKFKKYWDNINMVMILYITTVLPIKISFDLTYPSVTFWTIIELLIDLFFVVDLMINFFTPFYKSGVLEIRHLMIAKKYLLMWFWIDLFAILPLEYLFNELESEYSSLLKLSRLPRLYRYMRVAKLLRAFRIRKKGKNVDPFFLKFYTWMMNRHRFTLDIILHFLKVLAVIHLFACLWYYSNDISRSVETWVHRYEFEDEQQLDRYIASVYYVFTTFTTTGYGDIVPTTTLEFALTLLFMAVGVIFFSKLYQVMISNMFLIVSHNEDCNTARKLLTSLNSLLFKKHPVLFQMLHNEISKSKVNIDYEEKAIFKPDFRNVRPNLQREFFNQICNSEYRFDKLDFLGDLPNHLRLVAYSNLSISKYEFGELIYEEGQVASHFYVIKKGSVWALSSTSNQEIFGDINSIPFVSINTFFGEFEILEGSHRKWSVVALENTVVLTIPKADFLHILDDHKIGSAFLQSTFERLNLFNQYEKESIREATLMRSSMLPRRKALARGIQIIQIPQHIQISTPAKKERDKADVSNLNTQTPAAWQREI